MSQLNGQILPETDLNLPDPYGRHIHTQSLESHIWHPDPFTDDSDWVSGFGSASHRDLDLLDLLSDDDLPAIHVTSLSRAGRTRGPGLDFDTDPGTDLNPEDNFLFCLEGEERRSGFEGLEWWEVEEIEEVSNLERDSHSYSDSFLAALLDEYDVVGADNGDFLGRFAEYQRPSGPAAKMVVESLPFVELTAEEYRGSTAVCAVCKDEIVVEEKVRRLPCAHYYHGDCIVPWLSIRNTCPLCRYELPADEPEL